MGNINFVKEPAYTYDLMWVYMMYFNKDFFLRSRKSYKRSEENIEYFQRMLDYFAPISNELGVFFYMPKDCKSFMMQWYWGEYRRKRIHDEGMLDAMLGVLKHYDWIINGVMRFYFKDITDELIQECRTSMKSLNKLIMESEYNAEIKSALYSFFIDPIPVIQKLASELAEKEVLIKARYEECLKEIEGLQSRLSFEKLASDMKSEKMSVDLELFDKVYVSISSMIRQDLFFVKHQNELTLIIGLDYEEFSEWWFSFGAPIRLDWIGTALSEKNRIDILNLMLQKQEVTQREIEKELGMTPANSYYHMGLLIKANIIKRRHQGRTILYSINKECIEEATRELSKYAK